MAIEWGFGEDLGKKEVFWRDRGMAEAVYPGFQFIGRLEDRLRSAPGLFGRPDRSHQAYLSGPRKVTLFPDDEVVSDVEREINGRSIIFSQEPSGKVKGMRTFR